MPSTRASTMLIVLLAGVGPIVAVAATSDDPTDPDSLRVNPAPPTAFTFGTGGSVLDLLAWEADLIAAGSFLSLGTERVNRVARWDGATWHPLGVGMNGTVHALTVYHGDLIAAGSFKTAGGVAANRIARWDGESWHPLDVGLNGPAYCLAVYRDTLFVGGNFHMAGGSPAICLAKWDGERWRRAVLPAGYGWMGGGSPGFFSLSVLRERLVALWSPIPGEDQLLVWSAHGMEWDGTAWVLYDDVQSWVRFQDPVTVVEWGGELIAGGTFGGGWGGWEDGIARLTPDGWSPMGNPLPLRVSALGVFDNRPVAATAGDYDADPPGRIFMWNGLDWDPVAGAPRGDFRALATYRGELIAGGNAPLGVLRWDGDQWSVLSPPQPSATASVQQDGVSLTWTTPDVPGSAGVMIRFLNDEYPSGPLDGQPVPGPTGDGRFPAAPGGLGSFFHALPPDGLTYYYCVFAYGSGGEWMSAPTQIAVRMPDHLVPSLSLEARNNASSPETLSLLLTASEPLDSTRVNVVINETLHPMRGVGTDLVRWTIELPIRSEEDSLRIHACASDLSNNFACTIADLRIARVGSRGGVSFASVDGFLQLELPRGTLPAGSFATIAACGSSDPSLAGRCYAIGPEGARTAGAGLSYRYAPEEADGIFPDQLFFTGPDGGRPICYVDPAGARLVASVDQLGVYRIEVGSRDSSPIVEPDYLRMERPRPNPFRDATLLQLEIRSPQWLRVTVFDVMGRRVAKLLDAYAYPGIRTIEWDGRTESDRAVPFGVYFCLVEGERAAAHQRLVRVRHSIP